MFVILTSKTGQFRTEIAEGLRACEAYDYMFCGHKRAHFVIAELVRESKIRVIDEAPPEVACEIPTKLFAKFPTVAAAREELGQLTRFGGGDAALEKIS